MILTLNAHHYYRVLTRNRGVEAGMQQANPNFQGSDNARRARAWTGMHGRPQLGLSPKFCCNSPF
eukprot:1137243-Pelagomonas_calceolata.AAC.7